MGDVVTVLFVAIVASAATLWLTSRATGLPFRHLANGVLTLGRRKGPLTAAAVNHAYRALMRDAGVRGPFGAVRVPEVTVVMTPPADYAYITGFGEREFERQLIEWRHALAEKLSWDHDLDGRESIIFVRDPKRATLHPKIAPPGASDGHTALLGARSGTTSPTRPHTGPGIASTHPFDADAMQATGAMSRLVIGPTTVALDPSRPDSTVGSSPSCAVHVPHRHFSSVQFTLKARGADWLITPVRSSKNPTYLNRVRLLHEAHLADGDRITVGDAEAIVFRL